MKWLFIIGFLFVGSAGASVHQTTLERTLKAAKHEQKCADNARLTWKLADARGKILRGESEQEEINLLLAWIYANPDISAIELAEMMYTACMRSP